MNYESIRYKIILTGFDAESPTKISHKLSLFDVAEGKSSKGDSAGTLKIEEFPGLCSIELLLLKSATQRLLNSCTNAGLLKTLNDLVSGKVNGVSYQEGKGDQFFYKYQYDADNRLTRSYSSRDKLIWDEDASYQYYLHGPLARMELGNLKVQGVDYAYTLQGWLKGINGDSLNVDYDMAGDGKQGTIFSRVSRDVYGLKLGYFNDDYLSIGSGSAFTQHPYTAPSSLDASGNQLFNGNISYTTLGLSKINGGATTGYTYGYDQLNRLVEMRQHSTSGSWSNSNIITAYRESIAYDANGNILKYLRKGAVGNTDMDSLSYQYNRDDAGQLVNNKLNYVKDAISSSNYTVDIDNQSANNYRYDKIGNLIKDSGEGLDTVRWTVYGKINRIKKGAGSYINYGYDPGGNRTFKQYHSNDTTSNTYYVRDAQGNVLAVYDKFNNDGVKWAEQHLYGSNRLGIWKWGEVIPMLGSYPFYDSLRFGARAYELTNHLGNVLATISDKKIGNDSSGVVNYYIAEVLSQEDYYPFGMLMPGRRFGILGRFGFNGKENDNEVKGEGEQQDYGMRIYDGRIGRFLSVDPITKNYPELTPYQFSSNGPISNVDIDGLERYYAADGTYLWKFGNSTQVRLVNDAFVKANSGHNVSLKDINSNSIDIGIEVEEMNTRAFLATITKMEDAAYNKRIGGNTFTGNEHPGGQKLRFGKEMRYVSAAGAYQFTEATADEFAKKAKVNDFSPISQDAMAVALIKEKKALNDVIKGDLKSAFKKLNKRWSSLPGGAEENKKLDAAKIFKENVAKELQKKSEVKSPQGSLKIE